MGFIVGIKTGFKIYYSMSYRLQKGTIHGVHDMRVVRELEIYDGPKISNCGLHFVMTTDVSQQKSI